MRECVKKTVFYPFLKNKSALFSKTMCFCRTTVFLFFPKIVVFAGIANYKKGIFYFEDIYISPVLQKKKKIVFPSSISQKTNFEVTKNMQCFGLTKISVRFYKFDKRKNMQANWKQNNEMFSKIFLLLKINSKSL